MPDPSPDPRVVCYAVCVKRFVIAFTGLSCVVLQGCISPENDRDTIGRSLRLEIFEPARAAPAQVIPAGLVSPSVASVERDNWAKTEIVVPVDGTAHNPTYNRRSIATDKSRRQRELYPTALTALDLAAGSETQQQREAFRNALKGVADIVFLPFRMIKRAPWRTDASPDAAYARSWHPELPPGERQPLPDENDPFTLPPPRSVTP